MGKSSFPSTDARLLAEHCFKAPLRTEDNRAFASNRECHAKFQ